MTLSRLPIAHMNGHSRDPSQFLFSASTGVEIQLVHIRQRSPAGNGVADKAVPPVVNSQCPHAIQAKRAAPRADLFPQCAEPERPEADCPIRRQRASIADCRRVGWSANDSDPAGE